MSDIIAILLNDATLTTLIGSNRVMPDYAPDTNTAIVYEFHTHSYDKITKRVYLTLRIIAGSLSVIDDIEERVLALLCTFGDEPLNTKTLACSVFGGANLKDPDTGLQHRILNFELVRRRD